MSIRILDFLQGLRDAGSSLRQVGQQFIKLRMPDESKAVFFTAGEIEAKLRRAGVA
jgi:hypothetical protein